MTLLTVTAAAAPCPSRSPPTSLTSRFSGASALASLMDSYTSRASVLVAVDFFSAMSNFRKVDPPDFSL